MMITAEAWHVEMQIRSPPSHEPAGANCTACRHHSEPVSRSILRTIKVVNRLVMLARLSPRAAEKRCLFAPNGFLPFPRETKTEGAGGCVFS
ncbi:hypothetical protein RRG08_014819 [Elysia crispata]|uniref:Uncharacterized protein n=1 Tax=Elysia crispata TaxID=231223 RepID=A0AAE1DCF7_9GAST|nr:hypothetical protein RRG08_014819 [Elysia crispata]